MSKPRYYLSLGLLRVGIFFFRLGTSVGGGTLNVDWSKVGEDEASQEV